MLHVPLRLALLVLSCALAAAGRRRDVESKSFGMPGQYCTVVVEGLPSRDLLQVIDESRVRVTFYLLGTVLEQNKTWILLMASRGHDFGITGWDTFNLSEKSAKEARESLRKSFDTMTQVLGIEPSSVRGRFSEGVLAGRERVFPLGNRLRLIGSTASLEILFERYGSDKQNAVQQVLKMVEPGTILSFSSESKHNSSELLAMLFRELRRLLYEVLPVDRALLLPDDRAIKKNY